MRIQSISGKKSSCENFSLLAEVKCHAVWKMIVDIISILPVNKPIGPDCISHRMLKSTIHTISRALCTLFNKSLCDKLKFLSELLERSTSSTSFQKGRRWTKTYVLKMYRARTLSLYPSILYLYILFVGRAGGCTPSTPSLESALETLLCPVIIDRCPF